MDGIYSDKLLIMLVLLVLFTILHLFAFFAFKDNLHRSNKSFVQLKQQIATQERNIDSLEVEVLKNQSRSNLRRFINQPGHFVKVDPKDVSFYHIQNQSENRVVA